jgi:hypothetical protein
MRSFTVPIDLEPYERRRWRFSESPLLYLDRDIDLAPKAWELPRQSVKRLTLVTKLYRYGIEGKAPKRARASAAPS